MAYNKVRLLTGGQVNLNYLVDSKYVVRVGRRKDSADRFKSEVKLLKNLQDKIPVPEVLAFGEIERCVYQVQKFIEGTLLSRLWTTLSGEQRKSLIREIHEYLDVLHQITFSEYGFYHSSHKYSKWVNFWIARINEIKQELKSTSTFIQNFSKIKISGRDLIYIT